MSYCTQDLVLMLFCILFQPLSSRNDQRGGGGGYMPLRPGNIVDFTPNFFKPGTGMGGGKVSKMINKSCSNTVYEGMNE